MTLRTMALALLLALSTSGYPVATEALPVTSALAPVLEDAAALQPAAYRHYYRHGYHGHRMWYGHRYHHRHSGYNYSYGGWWYPRPWWTLGYYGYGPTY